MFVCSVLSACRQQGTCSQVYPCFVPACSPSLRTFYSTGYTCTRDLYPLVPRVPRVLHVAQEGLKPKKRRTVADVRQQQFAAKQAALLAAHQRPAPPLATGQPLVTQDEGQGCGL